MSSKPVLFSGYHQLTLRSTPPWVKSGTLAYNKLQSRISVSRHAGSHDDLFIINRHTVSRDKQQHHKCPVSLRRYTVNNLNEKDMIFNVLNNNLFLLKAQLKKYYMLGKDPNSVCMGENLPPPYSNTEEN